MSEPPIEEASPPPLPGWYGKLPALGDFASRRLPSDFIDRWDSWLQASLVSSRAALGEGWLDVYLTSPLWRFALMPGVCGPGPWLGVMMPSVDKVGRYFPLTIAIQPHRDSVLTHPLLSCGGWFESVELLALSLLRPSARVEDLEDGLSKMPLPDPGGGQAEAAEAANVFAVWWEDPGGSAAIELRSVASLPELVERASKALFMRCASGKSLWWSCTDEGECARALAYVGLPPEEDFAQLMSAGPHAGAA
jgi:type VI secretion system protein ImpM